MTHLRNTGLVALLFAASSLSAQKANIWYFGEKAGIDFNSGTATPLLNGDMIAFEGCSSICDENGQLRFYTNGGPVDPWPYDFGAVWGADHEVMPNGDLVSAGGCNSSSQGSLIVQDPGNEDHYYLFTVDCSEHQHTGGFRYSEVNMALNNGLGDVTTAGTPLLAGVRESLVGIRHSNGTDVWVLVHGGINNDTYYSFLVGASGISGPDSSVIGPVGTSSGGQMSANLSGTKLHHAESGNSSLYDFDPATGQLSNYTDLQSTAPVFGCAFAPGGRYLYVGQRLWNGHVFQYDLLAPDIQASEQSIGQVLALQTGMQLAPDGKIYIAQGGRDHLGVIHHPDSAGVTADVEVLGFYLGGRESRYSLPNFVNDLLLPSTVGIHEALPLSGTNARGSHDNLRVYPNPANDRVNLVIDARAFGKTGVIEVFDVTGKLVHSEQVASLMALQPLELSSIQQEGLYLVMLRVDGHTPRSARVVLKR
ncbi:MAG: T9SS type A sorting domain-containing protein [Flavobacteriales bacterium]|nr:T9SS type A sorting domain-containing protein [Flavobacteriales bacterium]